MPGMSGASTGVSGREEKANEPCAALQEHQAKQIQARADLIALGIAPERAPWRRIRREAQEEAAEEQGFARRQAAALESARLAREPKPTDDTDE